MRAPRLSSTAALRAARRFCLVAVSVTAVGSAALWIFGIRGGGATTPQFRSMPFIDMWIRWDAGWYQGIAVDGYYYSPIEQSSVAFFPLYPLLIRALVRLGVNPFLAGIVLTFSCGLIAVCLFRTWVRDFSTEPDLATWGLLLWPFAFYLYGAVYSDALFLMLVLAAFLSLERNAIGLTILFGILATLCRPVAPAVTLGLFARHLERKKKLNRPISPADLSILLSAGGLAIYMAYLTARFGEPLAFIKTQVGWRQISGLASILKIDLWHQLQRSDSPLGVIFLPLFHLMLGVTCLLLLPRISREIGKGYAIYVAIVVGLPLSTSRDFVGVGRYCLAAFPVFAALANKFAGDPRKKARWLGVSTAALALMTAKFAIAQYVS